MGWPPRERKKGTLAVGESRRSFAMPLHAVAPHAALAPPPPRQPPRASRRAEREQQAEGLLRGRVLLPSDSPLPRPSIHHRQLVCRAIHHSPRAPWPCSWPDLRPPGRGVAGGGEGLHEVGKAAGTPNMGGGRPPERLANARGGRRRVAGDSSGDDTVAASVATLLAPLRFAGAAGLLWGGGGGGSGRRWRIRPRP